MIDVETFARSLLGRRLRTEFDGEPTEIVLTEVEAYGGEDDPASHAFRGETRRNRSMFGPEGTLYVYRSYGVHWCANIVAGPAGEGAAVLLRAGTPTEGTTAMARRRGRSEHLCDGPGKLCQALGITGELDGTNVDDGPVRLLERTSIDGTVLALPRVGISRATERRWRFVLAR